MILRCKNCGGAVRLNPATRKVECPNCGSVYAEEGDADYYYANANSLADMNENVPEDYFSPDGKKDNTDKGVRPAFKLKLNEDPDLDDSSENGSSGDNSHEHSSYEPGSSKPDDHDDSRKPEVDFFQDDTYEAFGYNLREHGGQIKEEIVFAPSLEADVNSGMAGNDEGSVDDENDDQPELTLKEETGPTPDELEQMKREARGHMRVERYIKESEKALDELYFDTPDEVPDNDFKLKYLNFNIYKCTACGAKLMLTGRDASTICAYCGQPSIVFDKVSNEFCPDLIIPFSVTKEEAMANIKTAIQNSKFVSREIDNYRLDNLIGVYIPYWMPTIDIRKAMKLNGTKQIRQESTPGTFSMSDPDSTTTIPVKLLRDIECIYARITADSSRQLNDDVSRRLEPWNTDRAIPFSPKYLTGFYANVYDVPAGEAINISRKRAKEFIDEYIYDSCAEFQPVTVESEETTCDVADLEYALLPVWFITFRCNDNIINILVNGQTGKVVAHLPNDTAKVARSAIPIGIGVVLAYAALGLICGLLNNITPWLFLFATGSAAFASMRSNMKRYNISRTTMKSSGLKQISRKGRGIW